MEQTVLQHIFEDVDRLAPEYVALWKEFGGIETRSDKTEALCRLADKIQAYAEAHGLQVLREHHEGAGDPLVLILPEKKAEDGSSVHGEFSQEDGPVALLGHFDTVHDTGAFGEPPVTERDGKLYGPGIYDMKGGVTAALFTCEVLRRSGLPHREIRIVLDPDEESGEHLGEERKNFHLRHIRGAVAAINCESGVEGIITVGRKGVIRAAVDISGVSAHAGNSYFKGASAIREAASKILRLEALSKEGGVTYNVGRIEGGTVVNIVPDRCHMEIDMRVLNQTQYDEALAAVDRVTRECTVPGCHAEWRLLHVLEPMTEAEGNHRLFELYARTAEENGLESFTPMVRGGGSDAAFPVLLGIPAICSAGVTGRFEHTIKEEADITSLPRRTKILAAVILKI